MAAHYPRIARLLLTLLCLVVVVYASAGLATEDLKTEPRSISSLEELEERLQVSLSLSLAF